MLPCAHELLMPFGGQQQQQGICLPAGDAVENGLLFEVRKYHAESSTYIP